MHERLPLAMLRQTGGPSLGDQLRRVWVVSLRRRWTGRQERRREHRQNND
jgi:hypothetical protein